MARMIIVGRTPCSKAPRMLKASPASQMMRKVIERPSADDRLKFSIIWGEKTTTQQAIEILPQMPDRAARSTFIACCGGNMVSHVIEKL